VKLRIGADGSVVEVRLHRSAGDRALDDAALDAVRRWRFEPAPVPSGRAAIWFLVPIEFRLR
jgi:protein TonB